MSKGFAAAEAAAQRSGGSGSPGRFLSYFALGDGESKIIRFLTDADDIVTANFHEFLITTDADGKERFHTFVDPTSLPGAPGEDWVSKYGGKSRSFKTKQLEPSFAKARTVGIAVEREEVVSEVGGKKKITTRDKIDKITVEKDGVSTEYPVRTFYIIKFPWKALWAQMKAYYEEYGTVCDRDYKISRTGTQLNTVYNAVPKSPDPNFDLKELQAAYGYGTGTDVDGNELTADSPDRFLYIRQTLDEWIDEAADEERIKQALLGTVGANTAESWAGDAPDEPQSSPVAAPAPVDADTAAANLRARLERHR